jgi:NADH:ubiquinone oxidoreductase subunit 2 (subunit N)
LAEITGTLDFEEIAWLVDSKISKDMKKLMFLMLFVGFAFKIPSVPFHQ